MNLYFQVYVKFSHRSGNTENNIMNLLGVLLFIIPFSNAQSDSSKWVWGRNDNTRIVSGEKRYNGELASLAKPLFQANNNFNEDRRLGSIKYRYEVTESVYPPDNSYNPRPSDQYRPDSINRPVNPYKPPISSIDNYKPSIRPVENEYRPLGNGYKPPNGDYYLHGLRPGVGTNGRPILTGPTPVWLEGDQSKYRDYDVCKCVHSFNCNTPGIKFGACDADKQYCCYRSKPSEGGNEKPNVYERPRPRPVLAGPGGPIDGLGKPSQDKYPVRPYRPEPDVVDPDRELNEAYKKGLASAIYELYSRPNNYNDREPQGYREYYTDRDYFNRPMDYYKSSHPSKYGLYYPTGTYGRSTNTTIEAISDSKNKFYS